MGQSFFAAVPDRLDLTEAELLANLQAVQRANGIRPDAELEYKPLPWIRTNS